MLVAAMACRSPVVPDVERVQGLLKPGASLPALAQANRQALESYREDEWLFHHGDRDAPPRLCISLSGGGLRAASFGIGVLSALHERGVLEEVDIISAASGGSYALSWFYAQQYYSAIQAGREGLQVDLPGVRNEMFDPGSRFQAYLRDNARILDERGIGFWLRAVIEIAVSLAVMPLSVMNQALLGYGLAPPTQTTYWKGLERVFHFHPSDDGEPSNLHDVEGAWAPSSEHPDAVLWHDRGRNKRGYLEPRIKLEDMRDFIRGHSLPYFIVTTNTNLSSELREPHNRLSNSIFELTPTHVGSDVFGRKPPTDPSLEGTSKIRDFHFAPVISGAAVDGSYLRFPAALRWMLIVSNQELGHEFENFHPDSNSGLLGIPFDRVWGAVRDSRSRSIRLSDGGHADNLALFPLIRRMCETIIVVDAEAEPRRGPGFDSYRNVAQGVRSELHAPVSVCGIDEKLAASESGIDWPVAEHCGGGAASSTGQTWLGSAGPFPYSGAREPRALRSDSDIFMRRLTIAYIKIGLDVPDLPESIRDYKERNPRFPNHHASDLDYTFEQFCAYRNLGHVIASRSAELERLFSGSMGVGNGGRDPSGRRYRACSEAGG